MFLGLTFVPVACLLPVPDATPDPQDGVPSITDLSIACNLEAGRWDVEVTTDAWALSAELIWTLDGVYLERHTTFGSVAAAADGSADLLRGSVAINTDFRGSDNGLTAFACSSVPSLKLSVINLAGDRTDCRRLGPATELLDGIEGVPDCPEFWGDPPVDTDTDLPDTDPADTDPVDTDPPDTDVPPDTDPDTDTDAP